MNTKTSAGLLMYRFKNKALEVFIVHPGGPFWKNKDDGAWSIPKGEVNDDEKEDLLKTAKREFNEETGIEASSESFVPLGNVTLKSGKCVHAWAFKGDWSGVLMCQSFVEIEYPPRSGKFKKFPEVDKASFFSPEIAKKKINPAQSLLIDRLALILAKSS
ncbi:MAG TPA: NUDIX domain-containing protein [Candidatus Nanoarchaeia archaeon]|nr:NUDIX domain-containing protein [Candidatus Nanoarchaeia archaeon]